MHKLICTVNSITGLTLTGTSGSIEEFRLFVSISEDLWRWLENPLNVTTEISQQKDWGCCCYYTCVLHLGVFVRERMIEGCLSNCVHRFGFFIPLWFSDKIPISTPFTYLFKVFTTWKEHCKFTSYFRELKYSGSWVLYWFQKPCHCPLYFKCHNLVLHISESLQRDAHWC